MVLILDEGDVQRSLTMAEAIGCVEEAFREYGQGRTLMPPRLAVDLKSSAGALRAMAASLPYLDKFGLKTLTGVPGKRDPRETYFVVLLFDLKDGRLLSVMPGDYLTRLRTGAATGLATRLLARRSARTLGMFGAGVQAETQAQAVDRVRPLSRLVIYDLQREKAEGLAKRLSTDLKASVEVASDPLAVAAESDILVAVTTSTRPVILGEWLRPGVHVNSVGANSPAKKEVDAQALRRSKVVVDFKEQVLQEAGDLMEAIASKAYSPADIHAELAELVSGAKPGRTSEDEITLFKSVGVAIEDVAVASKVYERAREKRLGREVPFAG